MVIISVYQDFRLFSGDYLYSDTCLEFNPGYYSDISSRLKWNPRNEPFMRDKALSVFLFLFPTSQHSLRCFYREESQLSLIPLSYPSTCQPSKAASPVSKMCIKGLQFPKRRDICYQMSRYSYSALQSFFTLCRSANS